MTFDIRQWCITVRIPSISIYRGGICDNYWDGIDVEVQYPEGQDICMTCCGVSVSSLVRFFVYFHDIFDPYAKYEYTFDLSCWIPAPDYSAGFLWRASSSDCSTTSLDFADIMKNFSKKITYENYKQHPITGETLALFCPDLAEMIKETEQNSK